MNSSGPHGGVDNGPHGMQRSSHLLNSYSTQPWKYKNKIYRESIRNAKQGGGNWSSLAMKDVTSIVVSKSKEEKMEENILNELARILNKPLHVNRSRVIENAEIEIKVCE